MRPKEHRRFRCSGDFFLKIGGIEGPYKHLWIMRGFIGVGVVLRNSHG